jgi:aryl-alcohol dehydrogenase-like predicted oxidoreductase
MDPQQMRAIVQAAFAAGVRFFDTADVYAQGMSEQILGEVFASRRSEVVLATKWGGEMRTRKDIAFGSRRYIRQAVDASLRRLQSDYIDLYQMHWPDPRTPVEETLDALDGLIAQGKVRYAGISHLPGWAIADAAWTSRANRMQRFVAVQREYNLLKRSIEAEVLPACRHFGVGLFAVVPLAAGLLTGKYRRDAAAPAGSRLADQSIADDIHERLERLQEFAQARGITMIDVALGWLAAQPGVSAIIVGASRPEQITANAVSVRWAPTQDDLAALNAMRPIEGDACVNRPPAD